MTFPPLETSVESGQPVELFKFTLGTETFAFTGSEDEITLDAVTYKPLAISRDKIISSIEDRQSRLTVTVPATNEFVRKYIGIVPGQRATLELLRFHRTDVDEQSVLLFKGLIQMVSFTKNAKEAKILVLPLTIAQRETPRFTYQNLCNHMLYDSRCTIAESAFEFNFGVTVVSGNTITVPGAEIPTPSDFFEAGFVAFDDDFRLVKAQSGDELTLSLPFVNSPLGSGVRVQAGCKHRLVIDCQDKFANVVNFGGFPFVPTKNPFETGLDGG